MPKAGPPVPTLGTGLMKPTDSSLPGQPVSPKPVSTSRLLWQSLPQKSRRSDRCSFGPAGSPSRRVGQPNPFVPRAHTLQPSSLRLAVKDCDQAARVGDGRAQMTGVSEGGVRDCSRADGGKASRERCRESPRSCLDASRSAQVLKGFVDVRCRAVNLWEH